MSPDRHLSIKNSFILVFITLSLATGIVISSISFSRGFTGARDAVKAMNEGMNELAVLKVREFLAIPAGISAACSAALGNGFIDLADVEERERFFRGIMEVHREEISGVFFETPDGIRYGTRRNSGGSLEFIRPAKKGGGFAWHADGSGLPVEPLENDGERNVPWFQDILKKREPSISALHGQSSPAVPALSAVHPVYGRDGKPLGVAETLIPFSVLDGQMEQAVRHGRAFAALFEKDSMTLLSTSPEGKHGDIIGKALDQYRSTGEKNFLSETSEGKFFLHFSDYLQEGLGLVVLTALPENLLAGSIKESARFSGMLLLLSQILSIAIYMMVAKKLLNPVSLLVRSAEEFAGGKLSSRAPVIRNDEIGLIARSFNDMADTVSTLFINLEKIVEERTVQLQRANRELEEQTMQSMEAEKKLQLLLDSAGEAVYGVDRHGKCTFCNRSFLKILGFQSTDSLVGKEIHSLIHHSLEDGTPLDQSRCRICLAMSSGQRIHADNEVFWRADGTAVEVEYNAYPQFSEGKIIGAVVTFTDNSERRRSRAKIDFLSTHDTLTGLHNRAFFENTLKEADTEENLPITVIFGDINGLKLTNDVFGHAAGDNLLKTAAELLKSSCRGKDIVCRLGGDEFAVIMTNTGEEAAGRIIRRIKSDFADRKIIAIRGSISMGYGTKTDTGQDILSVVQSAEEAMYREKTLYRKDIDSEMADTIMETLHEKCPGEKSHAESVREICGLIGEALGMTPAEIEKLKTAGYLHDIGKVVLDSETLNRNDGLVEEEQNKKGLLLHPAAGYRILNLFDATLEYAEAVFCHHEHWDGTGVPNGTKGQDIPLLGRILRVAESWDRLRLQAGNTPGWERRAVPELLEQSGTALDPKIAEALAVRVSAGAPSSIAPARNSTEGQGLHSRSSGPY